LTTSILWATAFHNERAAYKFVEAQIWPDGPVCVHCGATKEHIGKLKGKSTRIGLYKCYVCRKPFTVKMGTMFESSHVPMRLWLQAIYLLRAGMHTGSIGIRELQRTLGVGLQTAWLMSRRVRPGAGRNWGSCKGGLIPTRGTTAVLGMSALARETPRSCRRQSQSFVDMARYFGADESGDALARAFTEVLRGKGSRH
jgi:transposase-like protein